MNEKVYVLHVRHLPDYVNAEIKVGGVELREYDGVKCFVPVGDDVEYKRLPNDFYMREFMQLSPYDERQLLDFQQEYGLIDTFLDRDYNLEIKALLEVGRGHIDLELSEMFNMAELTHNLRTPSTKEEAHEWRMNTPERWYAISLDEVASIVENTQRMIGILLDVAKYGVPNDFRLGQAEKAAWFISSYVDKCFKTLSLVPKADELYGGFNVSVMSMICAQCLYGIQCAQDGQFVYRTCDYCHKPFQLGRKGLGEDEQCMPRPAGSGYCSPACQRNKNKHKRGADGKLIY